jgi:amino acid adenylation domain-containing protein
LDQLARCIDQSTSKQITKISRVKNRDQQSLSSAQQSLWILSEMGQGDRYHIPKILRIEGELNIPVLAQSLNDLIHRHEALRTHFKVDSNGKPYQFIENEINFKLDVEVCNNTSDSKEKEIKKLFKAFVDEPFDLQKDLLIRGLLIKTSENEFLFGLCIHHIVFDGWSSGIFMKELAEVYQSYIKNKQANLPKLPVQYLDYSAWQQEASQQESFSESLEYWKNHLTDYQDLDLSTDFPRPKVSSRNGKRITKTLQEETQQKLAFYCKEAKGTLFAGLLTSVYILLNKYTGQQDICIGIPVANREHKELENLVGFFVNTIVSRIQFDTKDTLQSIFGKIQKELMIGQEHQQVPFQKVVEAVQPNRDVNVSPIFQVMVNYLKLEESFHLENASVKMEESEYRRIKFDLNIDFIETVHSGLFISLTYNSDLYAESTAERLLESLNFILETLPEHPKQLLNKYSVLHPKEKLQVLTEFNHTEFDPTNIQSLHERFEQNAQEHPEWIAVQFEEETVTYGELHQRCQQLAMYLQQQGVTENTLVGIYMNKSIEVIVAMLGVLMSGGAYVPIDPEYPESRVTYILEDAILQGNQQNNPKLVLVQSDLESQLEEMIHEQDIRLIALESGSSLNQEIAETKGTLIRPNLYEQLAYVIYTSGSTGKPKGVLIEHRNVINLIAYQSQYFNIEKGEQILLFSSFSFDASVEQMYLSLFNAGTLHVVSKSDLFNTQKLQQILVEREITHLHAVPSFVREIPFTPNTKLKRIISGGDVFDKKITDTWGNRGIHLINEYGPTETTVTSIQTDLQEAIDKEHIGKPLGNTQCYIVDESNHIQPIGVYGELWIGGDGVARGYLNREELTQERFTDNPFGEGRIYKTGDIARWLPDGNIDFLGRIDHQVKIRGFRIELGEIESCINQHAKIERSVVVAKQDDAHKYLVAFCVAQDGMNINTREVRDFVQQQLPEYMVPSFIVFLDAIPLTANGKEDKKKLMAYEVEANTSNSYTAPSSPSEKMLSKLWEETLNIKKIGIHDNFFDLGGHSLLIIQLNQKIQNTIGNCTIELMDFMNNPTIHQQALLIEQTQKEFNHLITFHADESHEPNSTDTFIIPGMPGLVDGYYELANEFSKDSGSVYGIQMKGIAVHESPAESIEEMATHNLQVIKQTDAKHIRLIGHSYGGIVIYEMLKQLAEQDIQVSEVILLDCHAPKKGIKITQMYQGMLHSLKALSGMQVTDIEMLDFAKRVAKKPKQRRQQSVYNFITSHEGILDEGLFNRLYQIYLNAMHVSYLNKELLDIEVTLVIAKATKRTISTQLGWTKYFTSIETIATKENHFDLVKKPHISSWKYKLEKIELS